MSVPIIKCCFGNVVQITLILISLVLSEGCKKTGPKYVMTEKREQIGVFGINAVSNQVDAEISVPERPFWQYLVFVVGGASLNSETQCLSLATSMLRLRLRLRLYEEGESDDLYRVDLTVPANLCGIGGWHAPDACYIAQVEPFPYQPNPNKPLFRGIYPYGRNVAPFREGRLVSPTKIRLNITVLNPAPITNQVYVWLHCYGARDAESTSTHSKN